MKVSQPNDLKQTLIQFPPVRRDWDKHGGGKLVFVKEGLTVNRIKVYETNKSETLTINNGLLCFHTGLLIKETKKVFFDELNKILDTAVNKYGVFIAEI